MKKYFRSAVLILLMAGLSRAADTAAAKSFIGEVADSQCAFNVHSLTRSHQEMLKSKSMGGTAISCTQYCIKNMGGELVLSSKDQVYRLDKPSEVQNYIGLKVKITGTLENKNNMIHVQSVELVER